MIAYCKYCYLEVEVGADGCCPECGTQILVDFKDVPDNIDFDDDWDEEDVDGEIEDGLSDT